MYFSNNSFDLVSGVELTLAFEMIDYFLEMMVAWNRNHVVIDSITLCFLQSSKELTRWEFNLGWERWLHTNPVSSYLGDLVHRTYERLSKESFTRAWNSRYKYHIFESCGMLIGVWFLWNRFFFKYIWEYLIRKKCLLFDLNYQFFIGQIIKNRSIWLFFTSVTISKHSSCFSTFEICKS